MGSAGVALRTRELLSRIPADRAIGAEVGVFAGQMSAALLRAHPGLTLYLVDNYRGADEQPQAYKDCGDYHATQLTQAEQEKWKRHAEQATAFAATCRVLCWMESLDAAATIPDGALDFVFIDADHSYEGVRADLAAWAPKVKPGGILGGHDYALPTHPRFGVQRAVDEAVERHGWTLELGENYTWFVRL